MENNVVNMRQTGNAGMRKFAEICNPLKKRSLNREKLKGLVYTSLAKWLWLGDSL